MIEHGWQEIVDGHAIILSASARNSRLIGRSRSSNFIAHEVVRGHIEYLDNRYSDNNKRIYYFPVAQ